jgi:hypothetical protein
MGGKSNAEQEFTTESTERTEKGLVVKPLPYSAPLEDRGKRGKPLTHTVRGKSGQVVEKKRKILRGVPTPGVFAKECGRI